MSQLKALGLADKIGNFEVTKDFDALIVDLVHAEANIDIWPGETVENRISKWIHLGDDRSIKKVYVRGVEVKKSAQTFLAEKRQQIFTVE